MKRICSLIFVLLISLDCFAQHTGHPRLFFTASDTAQIFASVRQSNSAASQLYGEVVEQSGWYANRYLDLGFLSGWGYPYSKASYYTDLQSLAFRYLVTGDVGWANRVKTLIFTPDLDTIRQGIIYDNYDSLSPRQIGQQVITLSILYDWLYHQLDTTQRRQIQNKIIDNINYSWGSGNYHWGVRAAFTREDTSRIRIEHYPLALSLAAMSLYGENANYSTSQADQDIATALRFEFTNTQSQVNRYFSPFDGACLNGISYALWMLPHKWPS